MEEIDNIIIESLKNINCSLDEEITSIKRFDPDTVVDSIACCLETINPPSKYSHKLPASMSARLKLATDLVEAVRELGFLGDIGYQTVLYSNEVEVRRVLMFLIERLPRDSDSVLPVVRELGKVQALKKRIAETVRACLGKPWVPPVMLNEGRRRSGNVCSKQSYFYDRPLKTSDIEVPRTCEDVDKDLKQYWVHNLLDVTKQCTPENLIPSLLFKDTDLNGVHIKSPYDKLLNRKENTDTMDNVGLQKTINKNLISTDETVKIMKSCTENQPTLIEEYKSKILSLSEEIKSTKAKLLEVLALKTKEESLLKQYAAQYKIKSKTLAVLSNEQNLSKLKGLIQNGNDRLEILNRQWEEVQAPLLKEYEELEEIGNSNDVKIREKQLRIKETHSKIQQAVSDLRTKEKMEKQLKEECDRFSKTTGRSAYTKRIMEIIGNINKQNREIQKILEDTKQVQKEINNLNGQLERSFTLSDELIFRNAIQDEMSRKAYKLLATLRNDCDSILKAITELGLVERESRNLQEQIDTEIIKSTGVNLERVNADLQNVIKEITMLQNNVNS